MTAAWAQVALAFVAAVIGAAIPGLYAVWRISAHWTRLTDDVADHATELKEHAGRITALEVIRRGTW